MKFTATCLLALGANLSLGAAEDAVTGNVLLRLQNALPNATGAGTLVLECPVRQGVWQSKVWGRGGIGQGSHDGTITKDTVADGVHTLSIQVKVGGDPWLKGGSAEYEVALQSATQGFTGTYKGWFHQTGGTKLDASGTISTTTQAAWPGEVPGFVPPAEGEHPRLIMRKAEIANLKKRLETPEGKAMWERFLKVINEVEDDNKFLSWTAVGNGFAYQMTGDVKYATKAKEFIDPYLENGIGGGQDIHFAPRALGIAFAYDLCFDAWDEKYRLKVADEVQARCKELFVGIARGGGKMGGLAMNPWSNHCGIRTGSAGVCALAVKGDKGSKGQVLENADFIITATAHDVRQYLVEALGGGYYGNEGLFYRNMTLRRGILQMLYAYKNAAGKIINTPGIGDFMTVGNFMEAPPGKIWPIPNPEIDGLGADLGVDGDRVPNIAWTMGWIGVPENQKAGLKTIFDKDAGLNSKTKDFGLSRGFLAPFLFASYPFDVEAKDPGTVMPWFAPDPKRGHYVFRPQYKDENDFLVSLNLKTRTLGGCHTERGGNMMNAAIQGLGKVWTNGPCFVSTEGYNAMHGAETTFFSTPEDRLAILSVKLDQLYITLPTERGAKPIDKGIKGKRAMALDFTGKCGAPAMIVVVDTITGSTKPTWKMALPKATVNGNQFSLGAETEANLRGQFVLPEKPELSEGLKATGGNDYFCIITIQPGKAPAIAVEGQGLNATVTVGARKIRFDGEKIVVQ